MFTWQTSIANGRGLQRPWLMLSTKHAMGVS